MEKKNKECVIRKRKKKECRGWMERSGERAGAGTNESEGGKTIGFLAERKEKKGGVGNEKKKDL